MSSPRPFAQIDVFSAVPGFGNPVAVVLDGAGLDDAAMQRFARWTNLSETTFVLPPTDAAADYRLRIFTPGGELPFAGHPTLGSCFAWLAAGGQPRAAGRIVQQCAKGLVAIRQDGGGRLAFAAPAMQAFPTPASVAASDPDTLRNTTKLGYRAPYIHELADAVAAGRLDLERLKDPAMPTAEVRKRLLAIKGVGGYAAANLLMILGRYDFIPIDSWAMNQVSQEWYGGQPVGPKEVEAVFERWGEWKGLVYWWWDWDQSG